MYPVLETKIFQRGIKQKAIAQSLGISSRSMYNKLKGYVPFTWPEVCILQREFFPDISKEKLFETENADKGA